MNYKEIGEGIRDYVGGEKNIESVTHCATRLRFVLRDEKKVRIKELENIEAVKGAFSSAGEFQIIIGQGAVNKIYKEILNGTQIAESSLSDSKRAAAKKLNPLQRFARTLSSIFVPIIPAIVASGLLMGLLGTSVTFGWISGDSGAFVLLDMFSNAAFVFLPILIAFSAAKQFDTNPYLAAALGGILIHPALQNAWTVGQGVQNTITVLGFEVGMIGYQGTVLPILLGVWVMGYIERGLRRVVPNVLDIIATPFLTLMSTALISLLVIGPLGRIVGDGISMGLQGLYNTVGPVAGVIFGGLYSSIVITGIHHSFHAIEAGLLANPEIGINFLLPIWAMANVAQGGAALAVYFKTNNAKLKSIAVPASVSCLLGITEAAIFGVNLKLVKPFIAAAIGGALGGGYVVITKVAMTAVGVTGIPGTAIVRQGSMINYLIGLLIAFGGAFIMTFILGFKEEADENTSEGIAKTKAIAGNIANSEVLFSPMRGRVIPLEEVPDKTFANKVLGEGIAIEPADGKVVSPASGTISHLFETKHAVAIKTDKGAELLIHVGIETVKMNGEGFKAFVKTGDRVEVGDLLLEFDLELLQKKAKSAVTPIVVTNANGIKSIKELISGEADFKDQLALVNS